MASATSVASASASSSGSQLAAVPSAGASAAGAPGEAGDALARYMAGHNPFKVAQIDEDDFQPQRDDGADSAGEGEDHGAAKGSAGGNVTLVDPDSESDDVPEELKADYIDEETGKPAKRETPKQPKDGKKGAAAAGAAGKRLTLSTPTSTSAALRPGAPAKPAPIMTTTSLHLVKSIGKYLNLAEILPSFSSQVVEHLRHVVEFYIFVIYSLFSKPPRDDLAHVPPPSGRLRQVLTPIHSYLKNGELRNFLKWESSGESLMATGAAAALRIATAGRRHCALLGAAQREPADPAPRDRQRHARSHAPQAAVRARAARRGS